MKRWCAAVAVLSALVLTSSLVSQDSTKEKEPGAKARGQLPKDWKKLGLTDEQKQAVYKTQAKYTAQIDQLKAQILQLQKDEKADLLKILSDAQKARLKEILAGEGDKK